MRGSHVAQPRSQCFSSVIVWPIAATPVLPHVKAAPPFAIVLGVENTRLTQRSVFLSFELLRGSGRR